VCRKSPSCWFRAAWMPQNSSCCTALVPVRTIYTLQPHILEPQDASTARVCPLVAGLWENTAARRPTRKFSAVWVQKISSQRLQRGEKLPGYPLWVSTMPSRKYRLGLPACAPRRRASPPSKVVTLQTRCSSLPAMWVMHSGMPYGFIEGCMGNPTVPYHPVKSGGVWGIA
jgi:hypothetical protein